MTTGRLTHRCEFIAALVCLETSLVVGNAQGRDRVPWTWTRSLVGKTITRALTDSRQSATEPWFDDAQRLRALVDALNNTPSLEQAETDDRWPAS